MDAAFVPVNDQTFEVSFEKIGDGLGYFGENSILRLAIEGLDFLHCVASKSDDSRYQNCCVAFHFASLLPPSLLGSGSNFLNGSGRDDHGIFSDS